MQIITHQLQPKDDVYTAEHFLNRQLWAFHWKPANNKRMDRTGELSAHRKLVREVDSVESEREREQDSRVAVGLLVVAFVVLHVQGHLTDLAVEASFMPVLEKTCTQTSTSDSLLRLQITSRHPATPDSSKLRCFVFVYTFRVSINYYYYYYCFYSCCFHHRSRCSLVEMRGCGSVPGILTPLKYRSNK